MSLAVVTLITFALVLAVFGAVYWLFAIRPEAVAQSALRKRLKVGRITGMNPEQLASLVRKDAPLSDIAALDSVLKTVERVSRPVQQLIDRAGLNATVGTLVLLCAVTALAAYALTFAVSRLPFVALIIGLIAGYLPVVIVQFKAKSRVHKFEEQFPEAIDLLARSLRAGHAFTTGLSLVAEEVPDPVGTEFRLAFDRQNFGMPMPEALKGLAERVPLLDARFFVTAVLTQREAGGNLAEVLDNLATVIRERFRVKRQVRVVTAHARMTGWVLVLLPPALAVVLTMLSPEHMSELWTDPTGVKMVVAAIIAQIVGSLIIRKLVDVEY